MFPSHHRTSGKSQRPNKQSLASPQRCSSSDAAFILWGSRSVWGLSRVALPSGPPVVGNCPPEAGRVRCPLLSGEGARLASSSLPRASEIRCPDTGPACSSLRTPSTGSSVYVFGGAFLPKLHEQARHCPRGRASLWGWGPLCFSPWPPPGMERAGVWGRGGLDRETNFISSFFKTNFGIETLQ